MPNVKRRNPIISFIGLLVYAVSIVGAYYATYTYFGPRVQDIINKGDINFVSKISGLQTDKTGEEFADRGLRTAKIREGYESLPKNITNEVVYKDVRLISTSQRSFSDQEIALLKITIDMMPKKLFDYRPWAIISTQFDSQNFLTDINPEGVAFTSGPYIFVGDVTFKKQDSFDTGTYRGLLRVMAHEFTHVAQFFNTDKFPDKFVSTYLEGSPIMQNWNSTQGWQLQDNRWVLNSDQLTTDYGKSSPVEDIADSVGSMVIGDEYAISKSRSDWLLSWLGETKLELYMGTIPLSPSLKQRKTETFDEKLLTKYKDTSALTQDLMNFQSNSAISVRDLAKYYATEFQARGWSGTINNLGVGEFTYQDRLKINLEIDKNPLRVTSMVLSVQ